MSTGLVWFRNDLRSQDNTSLQKAINENEIVFGVYIFDPKLFEKDSFGFKKTGAFRTKFLIESITDLRKNLRSLNISLIVLHKNAALAIPNLVKEYNVDTVYLQKEWTKEERDITDLIKKNLSQKISWIESYDQFLFHPDDIPFEIDAIPKVFTDFRKKCEKYSSVREAIQTKLLSENNLLNEETFIPTIKDFGFERIKIDDRSAFPFTGGENEAQKRVDHYFWETKHLSNYKNTRNGLVETSYSSKLSAWLANGSISARTIYHEVKKYEKEVEKNDSTYWLIFELIWRDFFKYISLKHGNKIFKLGGILGKDYEWKNDKDLILKWIEGKTDEPFVNANMVEFKKTGFMSNRGRQNVASYFAKELKLDWRIGAAYFESLLIDYDVHSNYGNWMYVAGVGNDPRDRKFNIQSQANRYDPNQEYQNLWLEKEK